MARSLQNIYAEWLLVDRVTIDGCFKKEKLFQVWL
jgi:hypothetical protein